jgi:septal ring factor EnvC (AmiA/AmiB activator)
MTQAIAKLWQELAEVSASLSCAKDKLTSKLDQVVANVEETDKTKKAFKDTMFDTRKEAERSKVKIAEVQAIIQGLQMRISEIDLLAAPLSKHETAQETGHGDKSTNIVIEET